MKNLYKSRTDVKIDGVCAGIANYFDIDPIIIRLIFLGLLFAGGSGFVLYIIAIILIPEEPKHNKYESMDNDFESEEKDSEKTIHHKTEIEEKSKIGLAIGLIIIGILLLTNIFIPTIFSFKVMFSIVLIGFGALIIFKGIKK